MITIPATKEEISAGLAELRRKEREFMAWAAKKERSARRKEARAREKEVQLRLSRMWWLND